LYKKYNIIYDHRKISFAYEVFIISTIQKKNAHLELYIYVSVGSKIFYVILEENVYFDIRKENIKVYD